MVNKDYREELTTLQATEILKQTGLYEEDFDIESVRRMIRAGYFETDPFPNKKRQHGYRIDSVSLDTFIEFETIRKKGKMSLLENFRKRERLLYLLKINNEELALQNRKLESEVEEKAEQIHELMEQVVKLTETLDRLSSEKEVYDTKYLAKRFKWSRSKVRKLLRYYEEQGWVFQKDFSKPNSPKFLSDMEVRMITEHQRRKEEDPSLTHAEIVKELVQRYKEDKKGGI